MPAIERSAGTLFDDLPALKHLAEGPVISHAEHRWYHENGWVWVAEHPPGKIAGFLCAERLAGNLHIREISVHRDAQGSGLGRALIDAAIAFARQQGMPAVTLTTFREVAWNGPFYQRIGFAMLDRGAGDAALQRILADEEAHGMPPGSRVAMRLELNPP